MHTYTCMQTHIHTHVHTYMHASIRFRLRANSCIPDFQPERSLVESCFSFLNLVDPDNFMYSRFLWCVSMTTCMYVCMDVCMYIYIYIYIYIYVTANCAGDFQLERHSCLEPVEDACRYVCMYVCMYVNTYILKAIAREARKRPMP